MIVVQRINNTLQSHNVLHIEASTIQMFVPFCDVRVTMRIYEAKVYWILTGDPHYLKIVQSYS